MNSSGSGGVVLLAEVQHLAGDDVEEAQPAAHAQQRLRPVHAHRRAEAAVELDDRRLADGLGRDVVGHLDVGQRLHVEGLDRVLGDHAGLAVLEEPVVVRERVDRDLVDARLSHLLARDLETSAVALACHASIVGCWRGRRTLGRQLRSPRARCATRCGPPGGAVRWPPRPTRGVRRAGRPGLGAGARRRHRGGVRLRRQRAGDRAPARRTGRRRQAGDRAGGAARPRPRLDALHRSRRPRPGRARAARADRTAARRRRGRWRRRGARPGPRRVTVRRAARAGRRLLRPRADAGAGRDAGRGRAVRRRGRARRADRSPRPARRLRADGRWGRPLLSATAPGDRYPPASAPAGRRSPPRRRRGCTPRAGSGRRRRARSGRSSATTRGGRRRR